MVLAFGGFGAFGGTMTTGFLMVLLPLD